MLHCYKVLINDRPAYIGTDRLEASEIFRLACKTPAESVLLMLDGLVKKAYVELED